MYKRLIVGLTVLLLAAAGAGQDISATGKAITNSADKHTP
jgi:predicted small secreted protein